MIVKVILAIFMGAPAQQLAIVEAENNARCNQLIIYCNKLLAMRRALLLMLATGETYAIVIKAVLCLNLTWLVLGGDPVARSHRVEQFTAL